MLLILLILIFLILFLIIHFRSKEGFKSGFMDGIDIIYWINLDRSPERRESMEKMFKDEVFNRIPNIRITATDGKKDDIYKMIDTSEYSGTDSEYGCLLSHLNAIKKFNESKYDIALILEDDCTLELKKYWKKTIKQIIKNAPNDWEIIMLCYINLDIDWNTSEEYILNTLPISSTLSYLINKKGSKKLVADCDNLSCYKDKTYLLNLNGEHKADNYIYLNTITYCYKYPVFIYGDDESTIHNDHLDLHKENKKRIIDNYR
jgi:GR25 family glycosyltransferase involved in LPS biosynthesis